MAFDLFHADGDAVREPTRHCSPGKRTGSMNRRMVLAGMD